MILVSLALLVLALLGAPLFAVIAAGALLSFTALDPELGVAVPIEFFSIAEMPILLAIPLFTFAGYRLHGYVDKEVIPVTDEQICFTGHTGMHRVAAQEIAKDTIVGIGR